MLCDVVYDDLVCVVCDDVYVIEVVVGFVD